MWKRHFGLKDLLHLSVRRLIESRDHGFSLCSSCVCTSPATTVWDFSRVSVPVRGWDKWVPGSAWKRVEETKSLYRSLSTTGGFSMVEGYQIGDRNGDFVSPVVLED